MTVTVRSFAKINLGLRIGAARPDGFHELLTVYQTIGLHDVIRVSAGRGSGIEIRCEDPRVPRDESNTCFRIVERALAALRVKARVTIEIEKRLPVQGGLGGASANAVAALLGLERALRKSLAPAERFRIASEVGSDLPLFLVGGTVLGVGRGEQVYPLPDLPAMACVVVTPEVGVSTPKAFAEWDQLCGAGLCGAGTPAREELAEPCSALGLKPNSFDHRDAALKGRSSTDHMSVDSKGRSSTGDQAAGVSRARKTGENLRQGQGRLSGTPHLPNSGEKPAEPGSARTAEGGRPHMGSEVFHLSEHAKLTVSSTSDRMNELGRGLSAWLSQLHSSAPSQFLARRSQAGNPLLWLVRAGIENDFERVVFPEYPELREGKRALVSAGAKCASLSGSGSALYGLFASKQAAVMAAARLRKEGWVAQATSTLTRRAYWRRVVRG